MLLVVPAAESLPETKNVMLTVSRDDDDLVDARSSRASTDGA